MKRLYTAMIAGAWLTLSGMAAPLSPQAALDRAHANAPCGVKGFTTQRGLRHIDTRKCGGEAMLYLFGDETRGNYVVVSADDRLPALIGYGDQLKDSKGEYAPGFEYWLEYMGRRAEYYLAQDAGTTGKMIMRERPERSAIAPLLTTTWSQTAPYNNLCPKEGTERTVTGCVATAMAQVMNYFKWPDIGEGSISYSVGNKNYSANFEKWNYDFDKMYDYYTGEEDSSQWLAVARLMYLAGHSVKMKYSVDGSGAASMNIAPALGSYFKYDKSLQYLERDFYSLMDWENLIYNNLKEVGPVIYNGQSYIGGHSFVCDGYQSGGYFHFNWGWGGLSDGYFLLDLLDPLDQGVGGSLSNSGFDFMQDVVLGIRPDRDGTSEWGASMVSTGSIDISYDEAEKLIIVNNLIYSEGPGPEMSGELGLAFTPEGEEYGNATFITSQYFEGLNPGYGFKDFDFDLPEIEDGNYILECVYRIGEGEYRKVGFANYDDCQCLFKKEGSEITVEPLAIEHPEFLDADFSTDLAEESPIYATGRLVNNGPRPYLCFLQPVMITLDMTKVVAVGLQLTYDLEPGEELAINYQQFFGFGRQRPASGKYYMAMASSTSDGYQLLCEPVEVNYKAKNTAVETIESDDAASEEYMLDGLRIKAGNTHRGVKIVKRGAKMQKVIQ